MSLLSVVLIGIALAMDAFAVSMVCGSTGKNGRLRECLTVAFVFALFQTMMPVLGWSIGKAGSRTIESFDHIIAFGVLCFLGIKMILDSFDKIDDNIVVKDWRALMAMAVATSIDALTAGIVLPSAAGVGDMLHLVVAVLIIGCITFLLCSSGYIIGKKLSCIDPSKAQIIGGIVLTVLGVKSFLAG